MVVDGEIGPLTCWILYHAKPELELPLPVYFSVMSSIEAFGDPIGRAALEIAIGENNAEAQEIGGNNRGPFVVKYLNGLVPEGNSLFVVLISDYAEFREKN